ncbi:MAG TPA: SusC/RagA family TonB-linked outer membrane protein [Flavobacteriaceae bacterium]
MEIKLTKSHNTPMKIGISKRLFINIMRAFIFLFCATVFSLTPVGLISQTKIKIDADKEATVDEVFDLITKQTKYAFMYEADLFKDFPKVHLEKGTVNMDKLINESIAAGKFNVVLTENNTILIKEAKTQQQIQVSGKVTDENGMPIAGVTVLIKGTSRGTATDFDGSYSITVPNPENVLVFSALGFATQEITVGNQSVINVTLKEQVSELGEVVLRGYYSTTKREATGSVSQVKASDIEKQPVANPLSALQGNIAGLQITQSSGIPGASYEVLIRGKNSILNGNKPLFIINGVPYTANNINSTSLGDAIGPDTSPLNFINPNDIESVEVLKDADATSIYGSRGANGVILITTKKGKAGKAKVDINMYSGIGKVSNKLDLLNREQYLEMRNEAFANDGAVPGPSDYDLNGTWDNTRETDWQDVLIGGTSEIMNVNATISGGNENIQFLLGGTNYRETSVFPGDYKFNRSSVNINLNYTSTNQKFSTQFSTSYSISNNNLPQVDVTDRALTLSPVAPALFDEEGNLNWENSTWDNPLFFTRQTYEAITDNLIGNVLLSYRILPELELKTSLGYTSLVFDQTNISPLSSRNPAWGQTSGFSGFGRSKTKSWIVEPQLNFDKKIGKSNFNIILGTSFQEEDRVSESIRASNFASDAQLDNLASAGSIRVFDSGSSLYRYNAVYGRINYNLAGKYILNLTGRRDGSSRFGPGNQFANFGSIAGAWIFSEENFIKDNMVLNFGKIRMSYGSVGNDQIGDYKFLDTYSSTLTYLGAPGLRPTRLFNPDYAWEKTKKFEIGLELGMLNNNIFLSSSYYRNRSSNQLLNLPLAPTTGFSGIQSNLPATVQNTGLEFELTTRNVKSKDFSWTSDFNISFPKNKLISYPDLETSAFATIYKEGKSLNIKNLLTFIEVDPETGVYTFEDVNGNGNDIDYPDDLQFNKKIEQTYFGGLNNTFNYKGFQFDFMLQFVKQTGMSYFTGNSPGGLENQPIGVLNRWQQPGDITNVQQYSQSFANPASLRYIYGVYLSDYPIVDASFIRLQNIALSYSLPQKIVKSLGVDNFRIYVQGQNLFTITSYKGLDPGNAAASGVRLPPLRILTLGAQLTF